MLTLGKQEVTQGVRLQRGAQQQLGCSTRGEFGQGALLKVSPGGAEWGDTRNSERKGFSICVSQNPQLG